MDPLSHEDLDAITPSTSGPRVRSAALLKAGETAAAASAPRAPARSRPWLWLVALAGVSSGIAGGNALANRHNASLAARAERAWHGHVTRIARSGAEANGGFTAGGAALAEGSEVTSGMTLATDARTRARIDFDDGSSVILERSTSVTIDPAPRTLSIREGALVADVAHIENAIAHIASPHGEARVLGTKLAVASTSDRTTVEVMRGTVDVARAGGKGETARVDAAQEAVLADARPIEVTPANDLAQRTAFAQRLGGESERAVAHNADADMPVSGLGELRARKPGSRDEKDHAVALAHHGVKIRIAGNAARTEIDETFRNDTADDLEGIYRFPLPPGAQIERLALEVDGKLVEGAFVDKAKGAAIWRGALRNAAPQAPKPREEIVWVPGPWRDPALLEWQRGGRFELKIFPIPKHGSRRVVIAYTEVVPAVAEGRRYTYALPQSTANAMRIDSFDVDAQVVGAKDARVEGYEISRAGEGSFVQSMRGFTPSGDLSIAYALEGGERELSAWTFREPGERDAYVAMSLRPHLPAWNDVRPRDHVIVVDSGRAMFGERFVRAKRLAAQIANEMDRRDRIIALACDVTCRAMPSGLTGAGASAARDVDAFLAAMTPDGASDLAGAVKAAAHVSGHDASRDLRVILISDGAASAGYRTPSRMAKEVAASLDARAEVVAVPVGSDADMTSLREIARGGGGVVVPYAPGQGLEAAALDVLNAAYGRALRDVDVSLPPGLEAASPAVVGPMRAGGETILTARMRGDTANGDVVLRGTIGGERFEARYPISLVATSDEGNAFVPRLHAASFIADADRDGGEASKKDIVALSTRYAVPSRFTSLLVLESEAMFQAFGIQRPAQGTTWTGETAAQSVGAGGFDALGDDAKEDEMARDKAPGFKDTPEALSGATAQRSAPKPAPSAAPPAPMRMPTSPMWQGDGERRPRVPPRGRWMRRIWARAASVSRDASSPVPEAKITAARAAVQLAPDARSKTLDLARLLSAAGHLDELEDVVTRWSARDPLDADAIAARADLAARRGDRERALRIASGLLASNLPASEAANVASALAAAYERAGNDACAFRITAAELTPGANVACNAAAAPAPVRGDVIADATWEGGADLDIAIVAPDGTRASWPVAARSRSLRVADPTSRSHEAVAWSNGASGAYIVEVVRADGSTAPIRGALTLRALDQSTTVPFVLASERASVARADFRWESRLVPFETTPPPFVPRPSHFDAAQARRAIVDASTAECRGLASDDTSAVVRVTFDPSGRAIASALEGNAATSQLGACLANAYRRVRIDPFDANDGAQVVRQSIVIAF